MPSSRGVPNYPDDVAISELRMKIELRLPRRFAPRNDRAITVCQDPAQPFMAGYGICRYAVYGAYAQILTRYNTLDNTRIFVYILCGFKKGTEI